jgi:putative PEP-CTERM system TPR-repeat lipoprotein
METISLRTLGCALLLAGAAVLAGCGKDTVAFVASAKSYIAKSDYQAAIIEVKNALQKEPNNGEARLLLAQALLHSGDAVGAEAEVRKAIAAGVSGDLTYPILARALVAQRQFAKAIKELEGQRLASADARAEVAASLAAANASLGKLDVARMQLDNALAEQPGNVRALLLKAQLAGYGRDLQGALGLIDAALKSSPDDVDALLMKAEFEVANNRRDNAQKLMEHAIAAHPLSVAARSSLATLAATSGKMDIAKAQVAKMKEIQPRDFRTMYADALVAFIGGENARAHDVLVQLLSARPDHLPSMMLSGMVDFQLGSYATAEDVLVKVVSRRPGDTIARRTLAALYLRTGRAPNALDVLEPLLKQANNDAVTLRIAGEAYLATGQAQLAASAYERANQVDKSNVASQVRLAQVRFATGETTRAFGELEAISANSPTSNQADLALFSAHLSRREFDKALAVVDALEKKQAKSPLPSQLRGVVYFAKRDLKSARASFEKALEIQPDFDAAASTLATLDIQEGKPQMARERYDRLLAKHPKNEQLLLGSAAIMEMTGAQPDQVRSAFDKAVNANPNSVRTRLARIGYDVRRRDVKSALAATQAALAAIPKDPRLMDLLATIQLMGGDFNQAIDTLKQVVTLQPENPAPLLRLAELQTSMKDYAGAIENQRKALALKPDLPQAVASMARTYVASGRPEAAIAEARKQQKEHPDLALGYGIEGEVLAAQHKWAEAATVFKTALARQPASAIAMRLYVVQQSAGQHAEANAMADKWIKDHPKDTGLVELIAQQSQQRKAFTEAIGGYKRVLDIDPDDVSSLNNLAWILTEQNDPKGVEYAEHAHRLAPMNPNVLDTLGWALTRKGEAKRAVELLRMASALAPAQAEIRLHLAKAQADSGDKAGARLTLTELSKLDKNSPIRAEAEKLLATL